MDSENTDIEKVLGVGVMKLRWATGLGIFLTTFLEREIPGSSVGPSVSGTRLRAHTLTPLIPRAILAGGSCHHFLLQIRHGGAEKMSMFHS